MYSGVRLSEVYSVSTATGHTLEVICAVNHCWSSCTCIAVLYILIYMHMYIVYTNTCVLVQGEVGSIIMYMYMYCCGYSLPHPCAVSATTCITVWQRTAPDTPLPPSPLTPPPSPPSPLSLPPSLPHSSSLSLPPSTSLSRAVSAASHPVLLRAAVEDAPPTESQLLLTHSAGCQRTATVHVYIFQVDEVVEDMH